MTNAEKFKDVDSRYREFLLFCAKHTANGWCSKCPLNEKGRLQLGCAYAWLDLEAEEEKPMPCPFCGSDCSVIDNEGDLFVQCNNNDCQYSGKLTTTKDAAIAAHNRVCKAVDAFNESEVK